MPNCHLILGLTCHCHPFYPDFIDRILSPYSVPFFSGYVHCQSFFVVHSKKAWFSSLIVRETSLFCGLKLVWKLWWCFQNLAFCRLCSSIHYPSGFSCNLFLNSTFAWAPYSGSSTFISVFRTVCFCFSFLHSVVHPVKSSLFCWALVHPDCYTLDFCSLDPIISLLGGKIPSPYIGQRPRSGAIWAQLTFLRRGRDSKSNLAVRVCKEKWDYWPIR